MKNASIVVIIAIALVSLFSFTNNRAVTLQDTEDVQTESFTTDTVPGKKDSSRTGSRTVPYDSFGKPKKMDTTLRH